MSSTMILRKRKHASSVVDDPLILHLSSSPSPSCDPFSESEYEAPHSTFQIATTSALLPSQISEAKKRYKCSYSGCAKAYSKPSRLAEHERSHTGNRPFVCSTCSKSYLRESHLQAHTRSHLPSSSKPFVCDEDGCEKRFWTAQHLRVHSELHKGENPFKCPEAICKAEFAKHHQLREHICTLHAPPGTRPYRCEHNGCSKSFSTFQKLRTHVKTHDDKRYTCVHPSCMTPAHASPVYYPTWTSLQQHMRDVHPPTCPYLSCNGKTFTAQKGLRAHLRIHEQREMEAGLRGNDGDDEHGDNDDEPPQKKRRGGEVGRDFVCEFDGCDKDFKSKKALTNHHKVNHLGHRDFVCTYPGCNRTFGYKHLLQRHIARIHVPESEDEDTERSSVESETEPPQQAPMFSIDDITGMTYSTHSKLQVQQATKFACPHPDVQSFLDEENEEMVIESAASCQFVFSRAYDLRRHLKSEHGLDVGKGKVDDWVLRAKTRANGVVRDV